MEVEKSITKAKEVGLAMTLELESPSQKRKKGACHDEQGWKFIRRYRKESKLEK